MNTTPLTRGGWLEHSDSRPRSLTPFSIDESGTWRTGSSPFMDDCIQIPPHFKQFTAEAFHTRVRADSADTDFPIDEDSEDDFKFNAFGPGRFSRAMKRKQNTMTKAGIEMPPETLETQKLKLERMYQVAMVKLNMRLSILSKIMELISVLAIGAKWSTDTYISQACQLGFNTLTSISILWRYSGKYCLPEDTVLPELRKELFDREKRCIWMQALCKLASCIVIVTFSCIAIRTGTAIPDPSEFLQSTYLAAGFSTGGVVSRVGLTSWSHHLQNQKLGTSKSLRAENTFGWISTAFSAESAAVSYYLIYNGNSDFTGVSRALNASNYTGLVLAVVACCYAIRDLYKDIYLIDAEESQPIQDGGPQDIVSPFGQ